MVIGLMSTEQIVVLLRYRQVPCFGFITPPLFQQVCVNPLKLMSRPAAGLMTAPNSEAIQSPGRTSPVRLKRRHQARVTKHQKVHVRL